MYDFIFVVRRKFDDFRFHFASEDEALKFIGDSEEYTIDEHILWKDVEQLRNYDGSF